MRVAAEEVVLTVRNTGVVRVGSADHAELVRIKSLDVLHGDAIFQRLPRVTSHDVIKAAIGIAEEVRQHFVVRKFVGRRQYRVCFGLPFDLLHFN